MSSLVFLLLSFDIIYSIDIIHSIWSDDFVWDSTGIYGWNAYYVYGTGPDIYNYTTNLPIIAGRLGDYHGVYKDNFASHHYLERKFQCSADSSIKIGYNLAYCGNEVTDYTQVYINDVAQFQIDLNEQNRLYLLNDTIVESAETCTGEFWVYYNLNNSQHRQPFITATTTFEIKIQVFLSAVNDCAAISNITIFCDTSVPTLSPTTAFPTVTSTTSSPTTSSILPTMNPTTTKQICYTNLTCIEACGQLDFFYISNTTSNTSTILFDMKGQVGETGDADLYVKFGSMPIPTNDNADCKPYKSGHDEQCEISPPQIGTYYIVIDRFTAFSGVTLCGPLGLLHFNSSLTTSTPTTAYPTTYFPTTAYPTDNPNTFAPTTLYPTTNIPTAYPTYTPTTNVPTTLIPTTFPTTNVPTTKQPTHSEGNVHVLISTADNTMILISTGADETFSSNSGFDIFGNVVVLVIIVAVIFLLIFISIMICFYRYQRHKIDKIETCAGLVHMVKVQSDENDSEITEIGNTPLPAAVTVTNVLMKTRTIGNEYVTPDLKASGFNMENSNTQENDIEEMYNVTVGGNDEMFSTPKGNVTIGTGGEMEMVQTPQITVIEGKDDLFLQTEIQTTQGLD